MPNIDQATSYLKIEKFFTQLHFKSVTTDRTSKLTSRIWNTNFKYNNNWPVASTEIDMCNNLLCNITLFVQLTTSSITSAK